LDLETIFTLFKIKTTYQHKLSFTFEGVQYSCVSLPLGTKIGPSHTSEELASITHKLKNFKNFIDDVVFFDYTIQARVINLVVTIKLLTEKNNGYIIIVTST
jgi:hypothetical protein